MTKTEEIYPDRMSEAEAAGRNSRNRILALGLVAFMALVMTITMVRLKEGVARNQDWEAEKLKAQGVASDVATSGTVEAPATTEPAEDVPQ